MSHRVQPVDEPNFRRLCAGALVASAVFAAWVALEIGGRRVTIAVDELGQLFAAASAAVACRMRARRVGDVARRAWSLLAASCLAWTVGQVAWAWYDVVLGRETPFPSVADIGFLAAVPLAAAGVASFPSERHPGAHTSLRVVLDGVLVACSVLFVSWMLVLEPVYRSGIDSWFALVLSLAYPLGDVVTITAVVVFLARLSRAARRRPVLVGAGLLAIAVADSAFAWFSSVGTFEPGNAFDLGWLVGFVLIALGALRPGEPAVVDASAPAPVVDGRVAYLPYAPGLAAAVAAMVKAAFGELHPELAFFGFALVVLLGGRLLVSLRENMWLNRNLEATVEVRTAALHETEARFASLVRRSSDLVSIVAADGVVLYQSPSIERTLGRSVDEVVGSDVTRFVHPRDWGRWRAAVLRAGTQRHAPVVLEWRVRHADGSWHWLETTVSNLLDEPSVGGLVLNARDVTERKVLEEQLRHNAFHDPLTGLANRALFRDRIEHALAASERSRRTVAVLFIDLDDFKAVNDGCGHDAGDELLVGVAARLREAVREADTVARFGGDEFALLLEQADGEAEAAQVARRVVEMFAAPFETRFGAQAVGASVGIATGMGMEDAEELMRNADVAMYVAKEGGGRRFEIFRPEMHAALVDRVRLEADLRAAVQRGEFVVHYQPIVALSDGALVGVEALIRWMHPTRGLVPPLEFVPLAEATGLIVPIGEWLLRHACAEVAGWDAGDRALELSVNLSARQLREEGLRHVVREALAAVGMAPERLTLEITESMLVDGDDIGTRLQALREMGVKVAIDDFGTGYSSLGYLQRLPVDELKIDKSFVAGLGGGGRDANVVETILSLARQFDLQTVAEGVEDPDQLAELQLLGCSMAQGFYLAEPMPGPEVAARLRRPSTPLDHVVPARH